MHTLELGPRALDTLANCQKTEKGGSKAPPLSPNNLLLLLRYVVTERRPHHVIDRLRRNSKRRRHVVVPGPSAPRDVRILDAPAQATLRPVVELMTETECAFRDKTDVP